MNDRDTSDRVVETILIVAIITVIVLKIIGVITVSWLWLLSPLWIPLCLGFVIAFVVLIIFTINYFIEETKRRKENERN